jgi:hypothetical protein
LENQFTLHDLCDEKTINSEWRLDSMLYSKLILYDAVNRNKVSIH